MRLFDNPSRWLVFAGVAVAVSYALRAVAAWASRQGAQRLDRARRELGLGPLTASSSRTREEAAD